MRRSVQQKGPSGQTSWTSCGMTKVAERCGLVWFQIHRKLQLAIGAPEHSAHRAKAVARGRALAATQRHELHCSHLFLSLSFAGCQTSHAHSATAAHMMVSGTALITFRQKTHSSLSTNIQ